MAQKGKYPDSFYRVTVKAIIRNSDGRVLFVKEGSEMWDLPGGGSNHGELVQETLQRELKEEIHYTGSIEYELKYLLPRYVKRVDACIMFVFCKVKINENYIPTAGIESAEVAWHDPIELTEQSSGYMRELLSYLFIDKSKIPSFKD